ncbi:NYN domain-containing protein [Pelagophyceae sp. CCMP2097]|nr:NYN domain-containing protein [Pelagophyceae sp. CCMP2097]
MRHRAAALACGARRPAFAGAAAAAGVPAPRPTLRLIVERVEALSQTLRPRPKQYACLVDADNTPMASLAAVVQELHGFGDVVVRRVYGDFSQQNLQGWKPVFLRDGVILRFRPVTEFAIVSGKNLSDLSLAMDAIDMLHDPKLQLDGVALVSSDSDFTPLAARLREKQREAGLHVIGFGRKQTPKPFVGACQTFVYLENLGVAAASDVAAAEEIPVALGVAEAPARPLPVAAQDDAVLDAAARGGDLVELLRSTVAACPSVDRDWVSLSRVGMALRRDDAAWDVRTHGGSKNKGLLGLLQMPALEAHFEVGKLHESSKELLVRCKPADGTHKKRRKLHTGTGKFILTLEE